MLFNEQLIIAPIDFSASGDNTVVADPGDGRYIAVDFISFFPTTATTIQLKAGSRNLSGPLPLDAKQTITWENAMSNEHGLMKTLQGESLILNNSGAIQVGGMVCYRLVGN